jgi:uncharacterized protein (DUF2147 family)
MKTLSLVAFVVLLSTGVLVAAPVEPGAQGTWWSPKRDSKIEVVERDHKLFGKISWLSPDLQGAKDVQNPDPALRERPLLGLEILSGFESSDGKTWTGGEIYDPDSGKTYHCKLTLSGEVLEVRGFVGIPLFGRTERFTRN